MRAGPLALGLLSLALGASSYAADWESIANDDGIQVWQRERPGSSFVEFRGRGVVKATILEVAAVIRDANRETEWMESCSGSSILRMSSTFDVVNYNRTASPVFMISDRDVVLKTHTSVDAARGTITVAFTTTHDAKMPDVPGVVRMPKLDGHWTLIKIDAQQTWVEYQIAADPGGSLPAWVVNWASKSLPFDTIVGLRKQVSAPGYDRDREILDLAIDFDSFQCGKP